MLLLTTSACYCLQHSRNLGPTFRQSPVQIALTESASLHLEGDTTSNKGSYYIPSFFPSARRPFPHLTSERVPARPSSVLLLSVGKTAIQCRKLCSLEMAYFSAAHPPSRRRPRASVRPRLRGRSFHPSRRNDAPRSVKLKRNGRTKERFPHGQASSGNGLSGTEHGPASFLSLLWGVDRRNLVNALQKLGSFPIAAGATAKKKKKSRKCPQKNPGIKNQSTTLRWHLISRLR